MNSSTTTAQSPTTHTPTILQVGAGLEQGGVERGLVEMAQYLATKNWHCIVASAHGKLVEDVVKTGALHFPLPLDKRSPWHIIQNGLALAKLVRENNVDIIHAHSRAPAWAGLLASKLTGVPFMTTFHGTHGIQNPFKKFYNSSMVRSKHVVVVSQFIQRHVRNNYRVPEKNIYLAPRGYDPKVFDPAKVSSQAIENLWTQWQIPAATPIIMLPGRLTRWKGHTLLLEALSKLRNLPWKLVIVGGYNKKNSYYWELQNQIKAYNMADRCLFVGSQDDMPLYYSAADVVVTPTLKGEAFGRVNVEAQAMGKPVIATNHGGAAETILSGETGWLVRPGSPEKLSHAIADAITDRNRLKIMGEKAQKWVKENYTLNQMCQAECAVYEKILAEQAQKQDT